MDWRIGAWRSFKKVYRSHQGGDRFDYNYLARLPWSGWVFHVLSLTVEVS